MSFKRTAAVRATVAFVVPLLGLVLALAGCNFHPILKNPGSSVMEMSSDSGGCLQGAGDAIHGYLLGRDDSLRVLGVFDCAITSLDMFLQKVHGMNDGYYTTQELRRFIQTYFLKTTPITDDVFTGITELKQTLLGGEAETLTVAEVRQLQNLIRIVRDGVVRLRPYMPLSMDHLTTLSPSELRSAIATVVQTTQEFGQNIREAGIPYSFTQLDRLLTALDPSGAEDSITSGIRKELPMIRAAKAALIDGDSEIISSRNWETIFHAAGEGFGIYTKYSYLSKKYPSWASGSGREFLVEVIKDTIDVARSAVARHPDKVITSQEFDDLIDTFDPASLPITGPTLKQTLRPMFTTIFRAVPPSAEVKGLTASNLELIWEPVIEWSEGQRYLESLFAYLERTPVSNVDLAAQYSPTELLEPAPTQVFTPENPAVPVTLESAERIRGIIADPNEHPLFQGNDTEASFLSRAQSSKYSLHDLTEKNWMYALARLFVTAYRDSNDHPLNELEDKVTFAGYQRFYADVKPLFVELRLFLKQDDPVATQERFRETTLFTYAGTGDGTINVKEQAQMMALMISSKRLSDRIHWDAAKSCPSLGTDEWNYPILSGQCFRDFFFRNLPTYLAKMPGLVAFYQSLSEKNRSTFREAFEEAALGCQRIRISSAESQAFAMIATYVEVMFQRFDTNEDGKLELGEALEALKVFKGALQQAIDGNSPQKSGKNSDLLHKIINVETVFTYFLAKGHEPKLDIVLWRLQKPIWGLEVHADRGRVYQIFAALGSKDQIEKDKHLAVPVCESSLNPAQAAQELHHWELPTAQDLPPSLTLEDLPE